MATFLPVLEGSSYQTCDHCGIQAKLYCKDCDEYICDEVAKVHASMRKTKEHKVQRIEGTEEGARKPSAVEVID